MKIAIGILVNFVLHIIVTMWLYYFTTDILMKFNISRISASVTVLGIHILLILVYNGCPLAYTLDHHVLSFFGIDSKIQDYQISEMWLVKIFNWIFGIK